MESLILNDRKLQGDRIKHFNSCTDISKYVTIRKLGDGTFGEVVLCQQLSSGTYVALKKIRLSGANGQEGVTASKDSHAMGNGLPITSLREIKVMKKLQHKNILSIIDMAFTPGDAGKRIPGSFSIVFPFMDHDLKGLLDNKSVTIGLARIKSLMRQVGEGLAYLHGCDVLHRDIKLANILVSNKGVAKLADFGLARPEYYQNGQLTSNVVTLWYRPPEVLLGSSVYGDKLDMWGIGCVIGELLTGLPLLPGASELKQIELICKLCGSPDYQAQYPEFRALQFGHIVPVRNPLFDRDFDEQYRILKKRKDAMAEETAEHGPNIKHAKLDQEVEPEEGEIVNPSDPAVKSGAATGPALVANSSRQQFNLQPDNLPFAFPPLDSHNKPLESPAELLPRQVKAILRQKATPDITIDDSILELCDSLLCWNPKKRPSALEFLQSSWFFTSPLPAAADVDGFWGPITPKSSHELSFRGQSQPQQ